MPFSRLNIPQYTLIYGDNMESTIIKILEKTKSRLD